MSHPCFYMMTAASLSPSLSESEKLRPLINPAIKPPTRVSPAPLVSIILSLGNGTTSYLVTTNSPFLSFLHTIVGSPSYVIIAVLGPFVSVFYL